MSNRSLQSQALENQIYARRDRALAQQAEMGLRMPDVIHGNIRAQQGHNMAMQQAEINQTVQLEDLEIKKALANEQLMTGELARQQAFEELQWAKEIHSVDMIALQKRGLEAEVAMKEFQTQEAISASGSRSLPAHLLNNPMIFRWMMANGLNIGTVDSRGQVQLEEMTDPDEIAEAKRVVGMMDDQMMRRGMGVGRQPDTPAEALSRMVNTQRTPQHYVNDLRRALTAMEKARPKPDFMSGESAESPQFQARVQEWETQVKDLKQRLTQAQQQADAIANMAEQASGLSGVLPNNGQQTDFSQDPRLKPLLDKLGELDVKIQNTDR